MSYLAERFPLNIAREPSGGPSFSTTVNTTLVGDEQRNQNWLNSRHSFEVSHAIKSPREFPEVGAHFRMARGKLHHFRFRDWSDFRCAQSDGTVQMLTTTTGQLTKVYGSETGFIEYRKITRPYGAVSIWIDGLASAATTDAETGIVTFAADPGAAIVQAAFLFDVPCRYDTDRLNAVLKQLDGDHEAWMSWESVPIVEVRE